MGDLQTTIIIFLLKKERQYHNLILLGSIFDEQGERKPTLFCKLCKLIFSQDRQLHNESVEHKAIYQFLNPNCQVNIFFSLLSIPLHSQKTKY